MIPNLHFADPEYLWLLLLIPLAVSWFWYKVRHYSVPLQMSSAAVFKQFTPGWKHYARYGLFGLRLLTVSMLILALARPPTTLNRQDISV